jgi:hypothetical protein
LHLKAKASNDWQERASLHLKAKASKKLARASELEPMKRRGK